MRASDLCDLQWSQLELATGRLHVRRAERRAEVHPMQGDEIRALRRLQREQGLSYRLRGLPHMAWAQAYPTRAEVSGLTGDLTRVLRRIYARCVV